MRNILSRLFGFKYILITDFDGEINIRLIHEYSGRLFFIRMLGSGLSEALPGGKTTKSYVVKWEPLLGFGNSKARSY